MRNIKFQNDYFYHVYNRGVDKRRTFMDTYDYKQFLLRMKELNRIEPIGSFFLKNYLDKKQRAEEPSSSNFEELGSSAALIEFVAYNLLPNHYHFLVRQITDNGISKFMHKFSVSYTNSFNARYKRSGALFQGAYKAKEIKTNELLIYISAYINGNPEIHRISDAEKWPWSSYHEYLGNSKEKICKAKVVLDQFESIHEYKKYVNLVIKNASQVKSDKKEFHIE